MVRWRGQLSAEMLVLIVVVLAVLALLATQLLGTAKEGSAKIDEGSQKVFDQASQSVKSKSGERCVLPEDCESNECTNYRCS